MVKARHAVAVQHHRGCPRPAAGSRHGPGQHYLAGRDLRRLQGFLRRGYVFGEPTWRRRDGKDQALQAPRDKIVGTALRLILAPLWERHRHWNALGWGPERGVFTVIDRIKMYLPYADWVIRGDIQSCSRPSGTTWS
jgi:hypothetical protein